MIRTAVLCTTLVAGSGWLAGTAGLALEAAAAQAAAPQAPATAGAVTPSQAAPFLGDWTLALQGANGPANMSLTVKAEQNAVVGELAVETMPTQAITDVSMDGKSLALAYTFQYEGNPVDAVVWLTPGADGTMAAEIDFAGGAYVMSGTASKKQAAAPAAAAPR